MFRVLLVLRYLCAVHLFLIRTSLQRSGFCAHSWQHKWAKSLARSQSKLISRVPFAEQRPAPRNAWGTTQRSRTTLYWGCCTVVGPSPSYQGVSTVQGLTILKSESLIGPSSSQRHPRHHAICPRNAQRSQGFINRGGNSWAHERGISTSISSNDC
jgi:phage terminase large subunit-like protein